MTHVATMQDIDLFKEIEKLTSTLNTEPNPNWLQNTPDGKAKYIPVSIIENQLRQDFSGLVQFELISERRELNEYIVTARIKVFHPVIKQWMNYDGIGAVVITQKANTELIDFANVKQKNALQLNAPKAYAEAIKNAAKKIGVKYGANLNRKFEDQYEPIKTLEDTLNEVLPMMDKCNNLDELKMLWDTYPELHTSNRFKQTFTFKKSKLK